MPAVREEFHVMMDCPQCGHPVGSWLEEVPTADLSAENASDAEMTEEVEMDCETCGESFSATIRAHWGGWEVFLTDDPSKTGTFDHYDYNYDEWIDDLEPEAQPRAIFDQAITDWRKLVHGIADKQSGSAAVNRMLLVQLFSIVEAYLADAIIKLAHDDEGVASAIIQWHPDLKEEIVSLRRVAREPHLVRDIAVAQLKKTQFHRFELVDGMLKASLAHDMLPADDAARAIVMKSIQTRHHCVHRNGRDPDGELVTTLTVDYLVDLAAHLADIVARLAYRIERGKAPEPAKPNPGLEALLKDPFDQYPEEITSPVDGRPS